MASNKSKRLELQKVFGDGSMYQRAKTDEYLSTLPHIITYKKFVEKKHYTRKQKLKLEQSLNYHHMVHKAEGGATTIENGAVVTEGEHRFIHSLSRVQEEIINNHIRQWKLDFMTLTTEQVIDSGEIDINLDTDYIDIPVEEYHTPRKTKLTKQQLFAKQLRREKRELQKIKKELEDR